MLGREDRIYKEDRITIPQIDRLYIMEQSSVFYRAFSVTPSRVRPDFSPVSRPSYEKSYIFIVFHKIIYFLCERNILKELYYDRMVDFT